MVNVCAFSIILLRTGRGTQQQEDQLLLLLLRTFWVVDHFQTIGHGYENKSLGKYFEVQIIPSKLHSKVG